MIGIQGPYWTTDPNWIKPSIAIMDIWACGGTMVILLAALYGVPQHLYEAASMDGAGKWRRFKDITLPMISPALFFCFIILTLAGLNQFTQAYTAFFGAGRHAARGGALLLDLPVPERVRVLQHGLRVGDGVAALRDQHGRSR